MTWPGIWNRHISCFEGRANRTFNVNIQEVDSITNSPRATRRSRKLNSSEILETAPKFQRIWMHQACRRPLRPESPDSDSLAAPC